MKKKLIGGVLVLLILISSFFIFGGSKEENNLEQDLFENTIDVSKEYLELRILTDNTLTKASKYVDYDSWNKQMSSLLVMWEKLDTEATELEVQAEEYAEGKVSFNFINTAQAVTSAEINNVFDKAPAGKKVRTLAKFLGTDAKRAMKILEQTQNEVTADAWNEAGDTFKRLENSAILIKDYCKVAGFAAGVVVTGGAGGFAAASAVSQTAVIVAGADIVLEVSDDAAYVSLGDDNRVSKIVGDIRKITEPAAAILSIVTMPDKIVANIDKLNTFMFGADQLRSAMQDGKVIGISLPVYKKGEEQEIAKIVVIEKEAIEDWLSEEGYDDYEEYFDDLYEEDDEEKEEEGIEEDSVGGENEATLSEDGSQIIPGTKYGKDGKLSIIWESPLETSIWNGQARKWKLNINNFDSEKAVFSYTCDWRFYMDGEVYQERLDNSPCDFTSTFLEKDGIVTAEVDFKILERLSVLDDNGEYDYVRDEVETITLSHDFTIKSPVDTYVHP